MAEHCTPVRVRYADTDQSGAAYHGNYARWLEAARSDSMRAAGLPYTDVEREGVQMPVAELYVRYHRPVSYDQLLEVWAWVSELTPVRVRFEYRLCLGGESRALTTGHTVHAFVDGRGQVTRLDRRPELWARVREAAGRLGPAG